MIRALIPKVNLEKTGIKAFIKLLSKECGGTDLKPRTEFIRTELSAAINEMSSDDGGDDDNESGSNDDESDNDNETTPQKKRGSGSGAIKGLSVKKEISDKLAELLGQGKEMARTDIVKGLWDYIKQHDLQNPQNKREIILDGKMKRVFGCDTFTMFTMNKYVGEHIHPFKPVDLTPKPPKKNSGGDTKSSKRGGGEKNNKRKKSSSVDESNTPKKKKRKPKKPGLQPPYRLSSTLAKVVGTDILPRPQVVTALWDYIKKNGLQVCLMLLSFLYMDMCGISMEKRFSTASFLNISFVLSPFWDTHIHETEPR